MGRIIMMCWILVSVSACTWLGQRSDQQPVSLEYFLRWQRSDFQTATIQEPWAFLMPPAWAELPPQYQDAFSLYIEFQHERQELEAEWHFQMVIDPGTLKSSRKIFGEPHYTHLLDTLEKKIACTVDAEPGWVGASPKYIEIRTQAGSQRLFASTSPKGPTGPGRELGDKHLRRYLCSQELEAQLSVFLQELRNVNE